jgi:hypothetical protein
MGTIAEDTETIVEAGMEAVGVTATTTAVALEMREAMEMIAEVLVEVEAEVEMSQGALGTEATMKEETITGDENVNNEKIG